MLEARRLEAAFGVEVFGADIVNGLTDDLVRALADLLYRHRLVVLRDQQLREEDLVAFGRCWGTPLPHLLTHKRMPGFPDLMTVGNTFKRAPGDRPAVFWHTDQSYEAEPATATMLYCIMAPETGGETRIADMVAAYDALDSQTREQVEDLLAVHLYGAASGQDGENQASEMISDEQRDSAPPVAHPLVLRHPVTGHRALYAVAGTPFAIEGMAAPDAQSLLKRLKAHATQERFIYEHPYRVGDLAFWDTLSTLHAAAPIAPATGPQDSRLLWRVSVKGLPPVLRHQA